MNSKTIVLKLAIFFSICYNSFSMDFGKNKVQYTDLQWIALKSPHFTLHFHQNEDLLQTIVPFWIENAYSLLKNDFEFNCKDRIPIMIYGNTSLFTQTNIITELLPEEVGGFTELFKNRIAIPFNGSFKDLRHVLHHELVHAFIFKMLTDQFGNSLLSSGNVQLPLWFMEGAAEYHSSGWDCDADMFMIDRTLNSFIPPPGPALDGYMAYKGGQSFLFYLGSSRGDSLFKKFLLDFKKHKSVEAALKKTYRTSMEDLGKEWILELRRLYWPEIGCRINPSQQGKPLTHHEETHDYYNLKPRISPDGEKIAFFSDRYDYTRILITDRKGKVLQSIGQSGYGGFFESFHPFRSGLCWSPDGKKIAFVTSSGGTDEIRIVDIKRKKLLKQIRTRLTSLSSPDWSRDGASFVFTAVDSGKNDIFIYQIATDSLVQITNNILCEANPHFSPDGKKIVCSIEDSTGMISDTPTPWGNSPSDLAIIDIATTTLQRISNSPWSEKEPCFSPDGSRLLFTSNKNGIDNLYLSATDSIASARPLTNYTGSSTHPDWSGNKNHIAFTVFEKQGWDIWLMDDPLKKVLSDTLLPTRWVASFSDSSKVFFNKATLPADTSDSSRTIAGGKKIKKTPEDDTTEITVRATKEPNHTGSGATPDVHPIPLKNDDTTAIATDTADTSNRLDSLNQHDSLTVRTHNASDSLPDSIATVKAVDTTGSIKLSSVKPYRLSFSPDMVAVAVGMGTAYSPAGQMVIALSDLLGDHRITFAGDLQGNLSEYAHFYASYFYLKNRIDLGCGSFYSKDYALASVFGDRIYHEMNFGGFGVAQYPFSMFSRLEMQLFARHIEQELIDTTEPVLVSNAATASLSYIYDNILWGITGPLNGLRSGISARISPPLDVITKPFLSFEGDIRHYTHLLKRFVWANRLYFGASFPLDNDSSACRYLLGGNENWFLFQVNVDEYDKNIPYTLYSTFVTPFRGWNYVDLWGTKIALFNTEFRFPFVREVSLVWPLPIQIRYITGALFADIGSVWDQAGTSFSIDMPEKLYGGFGFGMRVNLGIFILRFDRGWPTEDWRSTGTPINYFSFGAEF